MPRLLNWLRGFGGESKQVIMKETKITFYRPVFKTRQEVYAAAKENVEYFDSWQESLSNSWKFYKK